MKYLICIFIFAMVFCGCSSFDAGVIPSQESSSSGQIYTLPQIKRWHWDICLYRVSEDHTSIEKLPYRHGDLHFNVNKLIEPPHCNNCLVIEQPQVEVDGTFKIKVTLRHPFPGAPKFTGFDVRGTVMFPATRHWKKKDTLWTADNYYIFDDYIPLYFSKAEDGGGELLNADGYTYYLWPGLYMGPEFEAPIFNYSKGQYAAGPDPDSTVNGFKLFTHDSERRIFLVTETITRTYHIAPPDGEFVFGYVVDASWAPPIVTPVTDPKTDFPFWANAEDGYVIEAKQIVPFKTGTYSQGGPLYSYDVAYIKIFVYDEVFPHVFNSRLICPDITPDPYLKEIGVASGTYDNCPPPFGIFYSTLHIATNGVFEAPPGTYCALLMAEYLHDVPAGDEYPIHFRTPLYISIIDLEVISGE